VDQAIVLEAQAEDCSQPESRTYHASVLHLSSTIPLFTIHMSFGPVISDTQSDIAEQNEDPAITVRREMLDKMEAQLDKFHDVQKQLTGLWDTVDKLRVSTEEMIDSLTKI
jgi:hypothetical protein